MGEFFAAEGCAILTLKFVTVIGFPLGTIPPWSTCNKNAIQKGADEIDMVINIRALSQQFSTS